MIIRHLSKITVGLGALLALAGCSRNAGWELNGTIASAAGDTIVVESYSAGRWMPVDTVVVEDDCTFRYVASEVSPFPEIYRLTRGEESIYFPVDSVDVVTLTADGNNFSGLHTLSGTSDAEGFSTVDSLLYRSITEKGEQATVNDVNLKRTLTDMVLQNPGLMMPYYTVTKTIGGLPLFNPAVKQDLSIIGAVANKFNMLRPDDSRTKYLSDLFTSHKFANNGASRELEAKMSGLPEDITRYDLQGISRTLTREAAGHPATVLSFTRYDHKLSPAYNVELNKVWERYHPAGLQIYQIAFDENEASWRTAAANIPWISVWNGLTDPVTPLSSYMVTTFPTTFILDRNGEVVERVADPTDLEGALAKYF